MRHDQPFNGLALFNLISSYSSLSPSAFAPASEFVGAIEVKPDRAAIPEAAGTIDPEKILKGYELSTFLNWERVVRLDRAAWGPLPRPCHMISRVDELELVRRLSRRKIGHFLPADELPTDPASGKILVSGWFCVPHKEDTDRLIQDKRPQNCTERHLRWMNLPSGPTLCGLFLKDNESLRGSADDFSSYFFLVKAPPGSALFNAVGSAWYGREIAEFDNSVVLDDAYVFCLDVLGMGGRNSIGRP